MEKTKHFLPLLVKGGIKAIMREEKNWFPNFTLKHHVDSFIFVIKINKHQSQTADKTSELYQMLGAYSQIGSVSEMLLGGVE